MRRPGFRTFAVASAVVGAAAFAAVGGARTAAVPPSNTALPTISGSASQGSVLSASPGSWSGDNPITFTYQWQRCDSGGGSCGNVAGATAQTYTLVLADVNHTLFVDVTAHNGAGTGTASSAKTGVVSGATPPTNSALPAISGAATVGSTLTASNGTWGGTAPITYAYSWGRCNSSGAACAAIGGATVHTYTVVSADVGHTLRATVTATNAAGSGQATSGATAVIVVGAPVNTVNPVVHGDGEGGPDAVGDRRHVDRRRADHVHVPVVALQHGRLELLHDPQRHDGDVQAHDGRRRPRRAHQDHGDEQRGIDERRLRPHRAGRLGLRDDDHDRRRPRPRRRRAR